MASFQASWLSSLNTISPTKPDIFPSNAIKNQSFKPFRISFSLNSANNEPSQPSSPNSPETTSEVETGPVDPVKLAFAKAKEYKNLAHSSRKLELEQNPVEESDGIANGNGGSGLVSDGGSGETKEVPDSLKIAVEKAKEYKKNKDTVDTNSGLKGTSGGISGNGNVEKGADKKRELSVSSIDFVGLNFADKKTGRGLPAGLVPVSDPFPEGDLPEVEFIVGDTSKFEDEKSSKPEIQGDDENVYKPKVSSWGVFPRPNDISRTFGGGRVIKPGEVLETEEEKAAKEARTRQLLAAYKSKRGLNIDPKLKSECEKALKDGDELMDVGKLKDALPYYEKVMDKMMFQSELYGLAALQWSICQDSLRRSNEARMMYEKLQSHPNAQVSKKARQFTFSFQAMEMMKFTTSSPFSQKNTGYQNYFEAFIEKKTNYTQKEVEDEVVTLGQTLPYIIFLVSPIFIVLLIAVQKRI
ncbi:uncharacterized protein LOC107417758 [Ziziphus jujuba]|uniref:Uncharacterized protein LOC107417758 n=2 Tax=Ziziphus jujuba TaxID=326968 RepID=A0A6P3ZQN3_ZIZJJ|nr:uncharacterized protein LOC107417758 [Ziziphus jujuba]KAH7528057.1 hypothetical protein FEM48_Zijuj05G0031300 [Ziziphus jujuba var. spinosa]